MCKLWEIFLLKRRKGKGTQILNFPKKCPTGRGNQVLSRILLSPGPAYPIRVREKESSPLKEGVSKQENPLHLYVVEKITFPRNDRGYLLGMSAPLLG